MVKKFENFKNVSNNSFEVFKGFIYEFIENMVNIDVKEDDDPLITYYEEQETRDGLDFKDMEGWEVGQCRVLFKHKIQDDKKIHLASIYLNIGGYSSPEYLTPVIAFLRYAFRDEIAKGYQPTIKTNNAVTVPYLDMDIFRSRLTKTAYREFYKKYKIQSRFGL